MSDELKPCPFCKGEMDYRISNFGVSLLLFECHDCGATVSFNEGICNYAASVGDYTPSFTAFNQRAERTCKFTANEHENGVCSDCGFEADMYDGWDPFALEYTNKRCPECGAKVVSGEDTDGLTNAKVAGD